MASQGSHLLQRVINLITEQPNERREGDIEDFLPWLRKLSQLFKRLSKDVLVRLLKSCGYQNVYRDHVIIRQGDVGDCFYVMLSGKTSLYIDTVRDFKDDYEPEETIQLDNWIEILDDTGKKRKVLDRKKFGSFIFSFEPGKSFGELALMSVNAVRNASIIADEETDLLVIDKILFNETLKKIQEEEYNERKDYITKSPYFQNWTPRMKRLLEMSIRKESYSFDNYIAKQGQSVSGLHFIISGEAKITADANQHRIQYPKLFSSSQLCPITKE